jgi:AcrR family transcriptional regulator
MSIVIVAFKLWNVVPLSCLVSFSVSTLNMVKNTRRVQRGENALTRDHIVDVATGLLDEAGEAGLTFRALAERLGTGAGAIYWHITDKNDLLSSAADALLAQALAAMPARGAPADQIRTIAGVLYDAADAHPWLGAALDQGAGAAPAMRMLEVLGRQVEAAGVRGGQAWAVTSTLHGFILGVIAQNAANAQVARAHKQARDSLLDQLATTWAQLDSHAFPFLRGMAEAVRTHDDRADFLVGIDLLIAGMESRSGPVRAAD